MIIFRYNRSAVCFSFSILGEPMRKNLRTFFIFSLVLCTDFGKSQTWSTVGSGITGRFTHLIVYNNRLFASGIDSLNHKHVSVACWDGSTWQPADSGLSGHITALTVCEGKLFAGEQEKEGANAIYRLVCWNDTLWKNISTLNGPINALAFYKGCIYAGGKFTMADTVPVHYIAKWNDTTWAPVGKWVSNNVRAIAVYRKYLYIGGQFGEVMRWLGKEWETVSSPTGIHIDGWIKDFCVYNDELYACGEFNYIAKWDNSNWSLTGNLNNGANTLCTFNGSLYTGGDFTAAPNHAYASHIAKYTALSNVWDCLGGVMYFAGDCKGYTGTIYSMAEYKGALYVGGQFMIAGGKIAQNFARVSYPSEVTNTTSIKQ